MGQAAECVAKHVEQVQCSTTTGCQISENEFMWTVLSNR